MAEEIRMSPRSSDLDDGTCIITSSSNNSAGAVSFKTAIDFLDRQSKKITYYPYCTKIEHSIQ